MICIIHFEINPATLSMIICEYVLLLHLVVMVGGWIHFFTGYPFNVKE